MRFHDNRRSGHFAIVRNGQALLPATTGMLKKGGRMNSTQAKRIHLKDLLARLGYAPDHEDKGEHWYLSPFRQEREASFKITEDGKGWMAVTCKAGSRLVFAVA